MTPKKNYLKLKSVKVLLLLLALLVTIGSYVYLKIEDSEKTKDYSKHAYYKDMMDDISYNVYDVIAAGEAYFKDRDQGKGSGYKQFQRWIAENEDLFYPSGDRSNFNPMLPYEIRGIHNSEKVDLSAYDLSSKAPSMIAGGAWTEIGPLVELKRVYDNVRNGNGRVDAIWVDPSDANRIYIGCRGGGLWTTTDGGANWSVKTDNLGITGVNSIAVNPNDVNEIYIATAIAGGRSLGVFKSSNGGATWSATGVSYLLTGNITIYKVMMSPVNSSVLFAATSAGLLKSTDGFQTFSNVLSGTIVDVEFKPGDTSIMYASNDNNNTIYRSTNSGASFSSTGVVGTSRPQLGVSANQPSYVYVTDKGVSYRSTDSGATFSSRGVPDAGVGQYGGFAVSDTNANLLINGSLDTYRSTDGGASFSKVTDWRYNQSTGVGGNFVHADVREVEVVNGVIYLGTDGWLCKSTDGGLTYSILTYNVGNHEIYEHGLGVSQTNPNTLVIGTQDNGTSVLRNGIWHHWKGGDGGTSMIDDTDSDIIYGSLYNGNFKRSDNGGTTASSVDLGDTNTSGRSLPPLIKHPTDAATIFMGGEKDGTILKSTNRGGSFTTLTGLGVNDWVDELAIAPSNGNYLFASIKSRLWKSTNGGSSWTEITGSLPNLVIKGIAIDYNDPNKIVVCFTSYTSGSKVYSSTNGGSSWTNISGSLPNTPTTDVVYDDDTNNTLYVSTDIGVYYRDDTTSDWTEFGTGLPNVRANDLEIQHSSSTLFVATWGRGVWKTPLNSSTPVAPTANFSANITNISEGNSIVFSDTSVGGATSWSWNFPGGTPSTSTAQNPTITYTTSGTYDVTLTATNAQGSDVATKVGYITVVAPSDLKGHYNFDGNLTDSSVYGLDLTDSGTTSYPGTYETDHNGTASSAVITGGASSYLENTQSFPISGNSDRTVTAWIKTSTSAYQGIVSLGNTGLNFHKFSVVVNNSGQFRTEVAGDGLSGVTAVADGTWHHVAVTYSYNSGSGNGTITLYVDGVQDASATSLTWGGIDTDAASIIVGNEKFSLASRGFVGSLDDVRIYSKALTAQEINDIKNESTSSSPVADFTADVTTIEEGSAVNFTDASTNTPTSWSWSFSGGTPSSSTAQNPSVVYNTAGTYDVTLTATNAQGNDVITKTSYITVTALPAPTADFTADVTSLEEGGVVNFTDTSTDNSTLWSWSFPGGTPRA